MCWCSLHSFPLVFFFSFLLQVYKKSLHLLHATSAVPSLRITAPSPLLSVHNLSFIYFLSLSLKVFISTRPFLPSSSFHSISVNFLLTPFLFIWPNLFLVTFHLFSLLSSPFFIISSFLPEVFLYIHLLFLSTVTSYNLPLVCTYPLHPSFSLFSSLTPLFLSLLPLPSSYSHSLFFSVHLSPINPSHQVT